MAATVGPQGEPGSQAPLGAAPWSGVPDRPGRAHLPPTGSAGTESPGAGPYGGRLDRDRQLPDAQHGDGQHGDGQHGDGQHGDGHHAAGHFEGEQYRQDYLNPPAHHPAGDPLGAEAFPDVAGPDTHRPTGRGMPTALPTGPQRTTFPWPRPGTGQLVVPDATVRRRWRKIAGRTLSKAWADSLFGLSSQAAFWSALSTAPLLLALLGLVGFIGRWLGPATITAVQDQLITFLHGIFSSEVVDVLLKENVENLLHTGQADLVSVGFFISLWAGSSAISAFVEAITIAYGQHEVRHPAVERLFALVLYLVALVAGVVTLPLLAIGPEALTNLFPAGGIRDQAGAIISVAYFPGIVIALVLLLATFYKVAPKHKHPWRRGIPGAVLATAVFVVASFGLRLYVSYVYTHGLTYGALATPITFLLFYYMMALAIIMGAQFNNATLEFYPPRISPRESRKWQRYDPTADDPAR